MKYSNHLVIRDIIDDGIQSTSSNPSVFNDVDISCAGDYGLRCTGGAVSFSLGRIDSCGTGISITNSTGSVIDSSVIAYSTHYGVYINNSNPVIKRNTISRNGKTGLYLYNTSINVGVTRQDMGNRMESNGMTGSTAWDRSEVMINFGSPGFKYCHNDFVNQNASTNKLVYIMNGTIPVGCGNYWRGYGPDPEFWFLPDGAIDDVSSWDVTNNRPAFTSTVDLITLASSFELQGDYEDAADTYMQALEADNDVLGLSGWIRCQTMLGTSPSTILAEVETWIDDETTVGESAFWFSIALQNGMADFETSIDELDAYIDDADTPEDSLRGVFGQLVTYYQMAHAEEGGLGVMNYTGDDTESQPFGLPQLGRLNFPVPRNEADYMRKSDELLSMFGQIHNQEFGDNSGLPTSYALRQNYPNPFNPTTTLSFDLMRPETVKLSVYNIMGKEVARLVDRPMQAGTHNVTFDASPLASGMYFYRIEAGSFTDMKRMVLVK